jgi:hypothetical protein
MDDLDTGYGSAGGIYVGCVSDAPIEHSDWYLHIAHYPYKSAYSYDRNTGEAEPNPDFKLEGLQLVLYDQLREPHAIPNDDIQVTYIINGVELTYTESPFIDLKNRSGLGGLGNAGFVVVTVRYTLTSPNFGYTESTPRYLYNTFYIYFGGIAGTGATGIMYRLVSRDNEVDIAFNDLGHPATPDGTILVLVLMHNRLNISHGGIAGNNKTVIIVAGVPDAVLGRGGGNQGRVLISGNDFNFYFGQWPFADTLYVATPISTYPYIINARGSALDYETQAAQFDLALFQGGAGVGSLQITRNTTDVTMVPTGYDDDDLRTNAGW